MAVFGLVPASANGCGSPASSPWAHGAPPATAKAALQARHTREAGDKLLQTEQALRTAGGELHTAAREIEARDRMLRQIEADAARRTRNADAARRAAAAQIATLRQRAAATQAYAPRETRQPPGPRTQPRSGSRRGASDARRYPAIAALLAGCQTAPRETVRYIPTACVSSVPARPDMPTERLSSADALDKIMQAALTEIDVREAYELDMRAALVGASSSTTV